MQTTMASQMDTFVGGAILIRLLSSLPRAIAEKQMVLSSTFFVSLESLI